jgi:hypothetical protein
MLNQYYLSLKLIRNAKFNHLIKINSNANVMHTKAIVFILLQLSLYGMHTNIFHDVSSSIVNFIPNFQVVYYVSQKHKEGNRIHVRTATFVEIVRVIRHCSFPAF